MVFVLLEALRGKRLSPRVRALYQYKCVLVSVSAGSPDSSLPLRLVCCRLSVLRQIENGINLVAVMMLASLSFYLVFGDITRGLSPISNVISANPMLELTGGAK